MKNLKTLNTTSSLDLSLNKDDLFDIKIDSILSSLEDESNSILNKIISLKENINNVNATYKKKLEDKLKSSIPKELSRYTVENISYYVSEKSDVTFHFKSFSLKMKLDATYDKEYTNKIKIINDEIEMLRKKKDIVDEKIKKIEKNPRRLKSQLLKDILDKSEEGKYIMNIINNKNIKLLE